MTIETELFNTLDEAKTAKLRSGTRHQAGWRSLQTDIVGTQFQITWVNGEDDPDRSSATLAERALEKTERDKINALMQKLKDKTITNTELLGLLENKLG